MHDTQTTAARLTELRDLGLSIAIDDFGTGYSSLAYLHRLPIDTLKIDRSFVRDIGEQTAVIRAIASLAHSLQLHVVAEGVETEQQREFLLRIGCSGLQGYLLSRPLPAERATQLLRLDEPLGGRAPLARSA
jgi:EAL domain-containing protein (putative c-di-GMP-specific phosphodiesterase class I)